MFVKWFVKDLPLYETSQCYGDILFGGAIACALRQLGAPWDALIATSLASKLDKGVTNSGNALYSLTGTWQHDSIHLVRGNFNKTSYKGERLVFCDLNVEFWFIFSWILLVGSNRKSTRIGFDNGLPMVMPHAIRQTSFDAVDWDTRPQSVNLQTALACAINAINICFK